MTARIHVLILVGAPGSGKSHFVRSLARKSGRVRVASADKFFYQGGTYRFDASRLDEAHAACLRDFIQHVQTASSAPRGEVTIIVDNTNTTVTEIAPYYSIARAYGASVTIVRFHTHPQTCFERGAHGAPLATVYASYQRARNLVLPPHWKVTTQDIVDHESYEAHPDDPGMDRDHRQAVGES